MASVQLLASLSAFQSSVRDASYAKTISLQQASLVQDIGRAGPLLQTPVLPGIFIEQGPPAFFATQFRGLSQNAGSLPWHPQLSPHHPCRFSSSFHLNLRGGFLGANGRVQARRQVDRGEASGQFSDFEDRSTDRKGYPNDAPGAGNGDIINEARAFTDEKEGDYKPRSPNGFQDSDKAHSKGSDSRISKVIEWFTSAKSLDAYLVKEIIPTLVFVGAIGAMLGVSLGALSHLIREVTVQGLPLRVAFGASLLQLPRFTALALPMACLAATWLAFTRLWANGELVAFAAAGVSKWRLLVAPVGVALIAGALCLATNEVVVPPASNKAMNMVATAITTELRAMKAQENVVYSEYSREGDIFRDLFNIPERAANQVEVADPNKWRAPVFTRRTSRGKLLRRVWYADQVSEGQMSNIRMLEIGPGGKVSVVVTADSCIWNWDDRILELSNCLAIQLADEDSPCRTMEVAQLELPMADPSIAAAWAKADLGSLSRSDIWQKINSLQNEAWAEHLAKVGEEGSSAPSGSLKQLWGRQLSGKEKEAAELLSMLRRRDAAAFSCVVYALIGASATLAAANQQRGSASGTGRSRPFLLALACILVYSTLGTLGNTAGAIGVVPPAVTAWAPSLAALAMGPALLSAGSKEEREAGEHSPAA